MTDLVTIILAAGDGTRMNSALPKLLHPVGGLPIISRVVRAADRAGANKLAVVTAPDHHRVREAVGAVAPTAMFFEQTERRGTAHAALAARPAWEQAQGYVAAVYADHPLLRPQTFKLVLDKLDAGFDVAILGFEPDDPTGYGRLIVESDRLLDIREHKDASEKERRIGLCNACILSFRAEVFRSLIDQVKPDNAQNELYVTDLVRLANDAGHKVTYAIAPADDVIGVNDRAQLAVAEHLFQQSRRSEVMQSGVTLLAPETVYFSWDTEVGRDVTIEPNVVFGPGVRIADGAVIHAFCHIEGADIGPSALVGPFARLRPGANLAETAKVGNFCEVKNANIGHGAKVSHLTYIGDAGIGARANIGAGTITCNYDGVNKHRTVVKDDAFIGSNSALVAPVEIGEGAYIGSGSVVTHNVEPGALAVARARQKSIPGYAAKLKARAQAHKNRRKIKK